MLSSRAVNLRSFIVCSSFVTVLFPTAALAQTTRDDGIKAFVRGDYVEAARLCSQSDIAHPNYEQAAN